MNDTFPHDTSGCAASDNTVRGCSGSTVGPSGSHYIIGPLQKASGPRKNEKTAMSHFWDTHHNRFLWETFSLKCRPLSASSISRGTNNRHSLTRKRLNPRTPSVDLGPWQCGTPLRDALHASRRSAPPAAEAVQPDPPDSSRREEGGEAGGRHDDRCEERRSDVRTLRFRRQESKILRSQPLKLGGLARRTFIVSGSLRVWGQWTPTIRAAGASPSVN